MSPPRRRVLTRELVSDLLKADAVSRSSRVKAWRTCRQVRCSGAVALGCLREKETIVRRPMRIARMAN